MSNIIHYWLSAAIPKDSKTPGFCQLRHTDVSLGLHPNLNTPVHCDVLVRYAICFAKVHLLQCGLSSCFRRVSGCVKRPAQQCIEAYLTMQEKRDDSWSAIYIRASPDLPRGGILMKMENDYAIVSA